MKGLPNNPNETFKRLNPQFYPEPVARRVRAEKPQSNVRGEGEDFGVETSEEGIRYCVVFTVYRKRLLDEGDNAPGACKAIRDLLAERLGMRNDSIKHAEFYYHQIKSDTIQGTHILIRRL